MRTALICGARFGTWYATLTSSTTGELTLSLLENVRRYWRNLADGDAIGRYSSAGASSDHLDHPFSTGSFTFPLRVAIVSVVRVGSEPWICIFPNRLICVASITGLV